MFRVPSINLGTPLFRLLKGFGTSASATKWGPAAAAVAWMETGGESGFAAIIQEHGLRLVPTLGDTRPRGVVPRTGFGRIEDIKARVFR